MIKTEASIDAEGAELIEGDDPEDALESLHSIDAPANFHASVGKQFQDLEFDDYQSKDDIDPRVILKERI